jgi:hypothetical protein
LLSLRVRSRASLDLELVAQRHYVIVLMRQRLRRLSAPKHSLGGIGDVPLRPRGGSFVRPSPEHLSSPILWLDIGQPL